MTVGIEKNNNCSVELTPEQLAVFALAYKNLLAVASHLGLSQKDALKPGAGEWMKDYIKQLQTAVGIVKTMQMQKSPHQNIESHESTELPPVPSIDLLPSQ